MSPEVREAAEVIIGNLSEDGYLIASDEELLGIAPPAPPEVDATIAENVVKEAAALGLARSLKSQSCRWTRPTPRCLRNGTNLTRRTCRLPRAPTGPRLRRSRNRRTGPATCATAPPIRGSQRSPCFSPVSILRSARGARTGAADGSSGRRLPRPAGMPALSVAPPPGQLAAQKNGNGEATAQVLADAIAIVDQHLRALQNKQYKEIARAITGRRKPCRRRWTISGPSIPVPARATTSASPG